MSEATRSRWFSFFIFAILCVIGIVAGGYIGARLASTAVVNNWVGSQADYTQSHVLILRQLRRGEIDTVMEQLESQLDKDIVSLHPDYYDDFDITDRTRARVDAALEQARQYREAFPREKRGRAIERDVEDALKRRD